MYNWIVYIRDNGKVTIKPIGASKHSKITYNHLDNVPKDIGDKVKLLMWTPIDGRSEYKDLGMRIGTNLYWVM